MKKVVINSCYGEFGLSYVALMRLREMGNEHALKEVAPGESYSKNEKCGANVVKLDFRSKNLNDFTNTDFLRDIPRDDPQFIQVVEELGSKANGQYAELKIVEIPDDVEWEIEEYDGNEHIAESHRTWS